MVKLYRKPYPRQYRRSGRVGNSLIILAMAVKSARAGSFTAGARDNMRGRCVAPGGKRGRCGRTPFTRIDSARVALSIVQSSISETDSPRPPRRTARHGQHSVALDRLSPDPVDLTARPRA